MDLGPLGKMSTQVSMPFHPFPFLQPRQSLCTKMLEKKVAFVRVYMGKPRAESFTKSVKTSTIDQVSNLG